ncbi:hypothetical protein [Microbacterium protaetiae]|uniref:hypothetical protein n=1 Tax=Microbacterium protaetiae TaxID=2509458 RepID=UPI0013ECA4BA|nr:hypothetical protein [Microbacterium protaetiae]
MAKNAHGEFGTDPDQVGALRAAVQMGIDDIEAGRCEDLEDVRAWMQEAARGVTAKSVA